jgi:putative SOS response-associated peptidase YedK
VCGRYSLITQREDLARALEIAEDLVPADLEPHYNIAPSQPVVALRTGRDRRPGMGRFRWGLVPHWAKDPSIGNRLINARRETLATKPSFRDPFRERRCAIVADGFYEWKKVEEGRPRVPHYIRLAGGEPFTFAGLWDRWRAPDGTAVESCTIVTGPPNELIAPVHDRMPVILPREARRAWLDPDLRDESELMRLLQPYDPDALEMWEVSRHVNSPDHDDPECIEPAPADTDPPGSDEPPSLGPLFDRG